MDIFYCNIVSLFDWSQRMKLIAHFIWLILLIMTFGNYENQTTFSLFLPFVYLFLINTEIEIENVKD